MKLSPKQNSRPPENAYFIVNGRRWRSTDPNIPKNLRQELVNELMAARRNIRDGKSEKVIQQSRRRVNDAKTALGERGHPWWLKRTESAVKRRIECTIRALLTGRARGVSICPSDVARIVGGKTWRTLLPTVRTRAETMAAQGEIEILRRGRVVESKQTEGVLRYRLTRARG